jgi:DNA replication protein DnaC
MPQTKPQVKPRLNRRPTSPAGIQAGFHSLGSDAQDLQASVAPVRLQSSSSARPNTTTPLSGGGPSGPPPVARQARPPKPPVYACLACHDTGLFHYDVPVGDPRFGKLYPCECQAEKLAAERARKAQAASDAAPERAGCRFEDYDATYNADALEAAREWAMGYAGPGARMPGYKPFLLLYGGWGTGKTHLLGAAFWTLVDGGRAPIYTVTPLLLDHLRDGLNADSPREYSDRFYAVRDCPLLILDDLGAEKRTEWSEEALFKLVDYRYRLRLPLAVATNLSPDELEPRIASRLQDRALARVERMLGPDWRLGS